MEAFTGAWAETEPYFNEKFTGQNEILERCSQALEGFAILQFEAEVWNATKYKGQGRSDLLKAANDNVTGKADPSQAVPTFWELVSKEVKK